MDAFWGQSSSTVRLNLHEQALDALSHTHICGWSLIEFAGIAKSIKHLANAKEPHFVYVILGPIKGNQLLGAKFQISLRLLPRNGTVEAGKMGKKVDCAHEGRWHYQGHTSSS
jgi:hypothetical protein